MPTLTKIIEGEIVWSAPNSEKLSLHGWQEVFGFGSPYTVAMAACRGGVEIENVFGRYSTMPDRRLIQVGDFPEIIMGLQRTRLRPDGYHFHPWSLNVDLDTEVFEVQAPDGSTLRFEREDNQENCNL